MGVCLCWQVAKSDLRLKERAGAGFLSPRMLDVDHIIQEVLRFVDHMGPRDWLVALAAVIVIGGLSLRGFGSRSKY